MTSEEKEAIRVLEAKMTEAIDSLKTINVSDAVSRIFEAAQSAENKRTAEGMPDMVRCRYSDCAEGHPLADDDDLVTCATCRTELALS